ncbi:MAG: PhnP protein [Clostridia bacterium]|nr:PhnP protein [Clostridia bacterium]
MKIQILGTAAAEGVPGIFCDCKTCQFAREHKGREIRTRSQALIDGKLLIDFPPDTYMHCLTNDINLSKIQHCLVTHNHQDHLYMEDIRMKMPGFGLQGYPITFYGLEGTMRAINSYLHAQMIDPSEVAKVQPLALYEPTKIAGYKVTALKAWHDEKATPCIYAIEDSEGKAILYGNDTNYFYEEVFDYLEKNPIRFDLVLLDCTFGLLPEMTWIGHMNLNDNIKVAERLKKLGCADEKTLFCSHHFSHNAVGVTYAEFSKAAEEKGFLTSYDGMVIEV